MYTLPPTYSSTRFTTRPLIAPVVPFIPATPEQHSRSSLLYNFALTNDPPSTGIVALSINISARPVPNHHYDSPSSIGSSPTRQEQTNTRNVFRRSDPAQRQAIENRIFILLECLFHHLGLEGTACEGVDGDSFGTESGCEHARETGRGV
jgi:hypothetical protein